MRAATSERVISLMALVLVISFGFLPPKAAAQSDKYPTMAPVDQYLMERNAEILLARSAAPDSISSGPRRPLRPRLGLSGKRNQQKGCLIDKRLTSKKQRMIADTLLTLRKRNLIFPLTSSGSEKCLQRWQLPYSTNGVFCLSP
jgi:hypothetical protein